ncbi:DUF1059 domain-containing protein [Haloarcula pellucida]|nr:DUF1059 domain-containing protein [Halomicroarcula pellucida]MBX0347376.1 DUF1059 domain-containing protein [Halomicroarcula pellucida]
MAHQYSCSACDFMVRSESEDEVVELVQNHAGEKHDMTVGENDVRDGIENVDVTADAG